MKTFQLAGQPRPDLGKKASKVLRAGDLIPAVLYGGNDVVHFTVSQEAVRRPQGSTVPSCNGCNPSPRLPRGRGW